MDEKEVVNVLRHYRHDLMNDLQIVYGYLSMGNIESVQKKLSDCLAHYNEERKLMSLGAPKFALWIIRFNSIFNSFHLSYQIHTENKQLHDIDKLLVERGTAIMNRIRAFCSAAELFEINLKLEERSNQEGIEVTVLLEDGASTKDNQKINEEQWKQENGIDVSETSEGLMFHFIIPCSV